MKSKLIAVSAISAGLCAILLTIGAYFEIADLFCLVIASIFVLMPLYFNSFMGSVLSFLAGGVIALIFSGFNFLSLVFPSYFLFFGLYPIIVWFLRRKNVAEKIIFIIGLVWCVAFFYGGYFYYTLVMNVAITDLPKFISDNILYFLPMVALIFYFIYHKFILVIKFYLDKYLSRIVK